MATGRLGAQDLAATTNTTLYQNTSGTYATVTVNLCNRNATGVTVRVALSTTSTPAASDWLEYDTAISGNGVAQITGVVVGNTQFVVVYSSNTLVSAVAFGFEG